MPSPSNPLDLGAIPVAGGVNFRVFAPFAQNVSVAGSFNNWSATANPMQRDANNNWFTYVAGAVVGAEYKYVIDGNPSFRTDARALQVTLNDANSVVYDQNAFAWTANNFTMPAWNELVIYEIHIATFYDPTPNAPGTFAEAIQKIPYLADLGINAIQVMPVHDFPGQYNLGYEVANSFATEPVYGGPDGFKTFVDTAHQYGLAVILDVVYNHLGPDGLTVWQYDFWQQNGKGGIYFYQDWRSDTAWTDSGRPDYGRGEVRQYIRDNAMMWLEDFQVDGLRWDSVSYTRNVYGNNNDPAHDLPDGWNLIQYVSDEKNRQQAWKILIGEDLNNNPWITKSSGAGGTGCDAQWDVSFADNTRNVIITPWDNDRDMGQLSFAIGNNYNGDAFQRVIYTESHDEAEKSLKRVPDAIWPGDSGNWFARKRSTLGTAFILTAPGIPMILQGQEFMEWHYFDVDPQNDSLIDWNLLNTYPGIHTLYQDLCRLRRNWFNNTRGLRGQSLNIYFASDTDKVIAYHRWDQGGPGDDVIIVANLRDTSYESYTIGFPHPGNWWVRFNSDSNSYSPDFGNMGGYNTTAQVGECQGMPCNGNIGIGPYSVLILSQ